MLVLLVPDSEGDDADTESNASANDKARLELAEGLLSRVEHKLSSAGRISVNRKKKRVKEKRVFVRYSTRKVELDRLPS